MAMAMAEVAMILAEDLIPAVDRMAGGLLRTSTSSTLNLPLLLRMSV